MRLLALLLCILCASGVSALGISPASMTVRDGDSFTILPILSPGESGSIALHVEGALAQHIVLETAQLQSPRAVAGRVMLPADAAPGIHPHAVVVSLIPEEGSGTVAAQAQVAARMDVVVPYPQAYLRAHWAAGPHSTAVTLENLGSVPVTPERVAIELEGGQVLPLAAQEVAPGGFVRQEADYGSLAPGEYGARLHVDYGDERLREEREIVIGAPGIVLHRIAYGRERGPLRPVDIEGTVLWNRPVNGTLLIFFDGAPVHQEAVALSGNFSHRAYVGLAGADPGMITATVNISGASSSLQQRLDGPLPSDGPWTWIAAGLILLGLLLAWMVWRKT